MPNTIKSLFVFFSLLHSSPDTDVLRCPGHVVFEPRLSYRTLVFRCTIVLFSNLYHKVLRSSYRTLVSLCTICPRFRVFIFLLMSRVTTEVL